MLVLFNLLAFASFQLVHSRWLACTDYIEKNGDYWDPKLCRGYPRDAKRYAKKEGFGVDLGYDHKPANGIRTCKTGLTSNSYSYHYPKAIYYPGQQVVLAHPMKGHAAASCTNMWIPDFGSQVFRGRMNKDKNRYYTFYKKNLVADLGVSPFGLKNTAPNQYPRRGYQNAPKFCEDPDRSMGTYSFNVPLDLAAGSYTFVWSWSFNNPTDIYTTCFDVVITANKAARDAYLKRRSRFMDISVPCGGLVSSGQRGSNVGCVKMTTKAEIVTTEAVTIIINPVARNVTTTTKHKTTTQTTRPATTKITTPKATTTKATTSKATTSKATTTTKSTKQTTRPATTKVTTPEVTTVKITTPKATTTKATTTKATTTKATTTKATTTKATTTKATTSKSTTTKATTSKATTTKATTSKATTSKSTTTTQPAEQNLEEMTDTTTKAQTTKASTTILTTTTRRTRNTFLNKILPIYGYQLSGVFKVGIPPTTITRRWLRVNFQCNIRRATFYNAEIIEKESNGVYQILQQKSEDVLSGRVEFFIEYESCNITKKPRVNLIHEE